MYALLVQWHEADPVGADGDTWEKERDGRIAEIQGNANPYVHGLEPSPEHFMGR